MNHQYYMNIAIEEAKKAALRGEVPVGAILVENGEIIARGHNLKETNGLITSHCEIEVLSQAAKKLGTYILEKSVLYVTLEPCPMCLGAILQARVPEVVFGALEPKLGAIESYMKVAEFPRGDKLKVTGGILEEESKALLSEFFRKKRELKQ